MPQFDVRCPEHGVQTVVRSMNDDRKFTCPQCGARAAWIVTPFFFQEDRMRLWRNPVNGTRYSFALGAEMPDSVRERDKLAREKGVEFVSAGELLRDNKEARDAVEYGKHVATGGKREEWQPKTTTRWRKGNPKVNE